jgi:hypothetical protein
MLVGYAQVVISVCIYTVLSKYQISNTGAISYFNKFNLNLT